ncbi:hypothetical protein K1I86_04490 [Streptococcus cristatus]|jgi:hypothetical protein|uniref:LiaF transmembrane domain-containing protein n=1 Tax=Streptococcus cristatus TaxID=45634 RepID=UPI0007845FFB|nr:hypothetical protein [Streptococcus cristatus]MBZ2151960.1 hypothetical protein [Streptococcus cristatus]
MKKTILGVGFLVLAGWILLQGNFGIPMFNFNIWPLLLVGMFAYFALENFLERDFGAALIMTIIALIIANSVYHFLAISTGTLVMGGVLACIGLNMIFKPRRIWGVRYLSRKGLSTTEGEISFGSGTRYINSENFVHDKVECVFGSATVYFDNARILGDSASFDVEVAFSSATLYIPSNWQVELNVDNAFGTVVNPHNVNEKDKTLYVRGNVAFGSLKIVYI